MVDLKAEHKKLVRLFAWILFGIYIAVLIYLMFLSERYGRNESSSDYRYNLMPFREIRRYFKYQGALGFETFFINIYGNVLAFMPFGFFLPIISRKNSSFLSVLLCSFELTLSLETSQLLLKVGSFDVDDMILNVIGGIAGYLFYWTGRKLVIRWLNWYRHKNRR